MASSGIPTESFTVPTLQTYYSYTEIAVCDKKKTLILPNELKLKITGKKVSPFCMFLNVFTYEK